MTGRKHFRLQALGVAGMLLVALGLLAYFLVLSGTHLPGSSAPSYRIRAIVPDAVALAPHADVRDAGVRIGEVEDIATRGQAAVLSLAIDADVAPVYRNARVLIRGKDLAAENYVDLDPGTPRAGAEPSGATLPIANAPESTQLDQVFSMLDRRRRRNVQRILDALGQGLGGHGSDLNRFLDGGSAVVRASDPVNTALLPQRQNLAGLIDDFGQVTRALGERATAIQKFARSSRVLAGAVAARDGQLRATLGALPGFLSQAGATSARLGQFSTSATPVVRNLRIASEQLVPAVRQLRPAARETRATMKALGAFAVNAKPTLARVPAFASATTGFTPAFSSFLRQVNPFVGYLAPYARDLGSLFSSLRGSTEAYDSLGHFARIQGLVTKSSLVGVFTPEEENALRALEKAGAIQELSDTRGVDAYPGQPLPGGYARVKEDPAYR